MVGESTKGRWVIVAVIALLAIAGIAWRYHVVSFIDAKGWTQFDFGMFLLGTAPYVASLIVAWRWPLVAVPLLLMALVIEWVFATPVLTTVTKENVVNADIAVYLNAAAAPIGLLVGAMLIYVVNEAMTARE